MDKPFELVYFSIVTGSRIKSIRADRAEAAPWPEPAAAAFDPWMNSLRIDTRSAHMWHAPPGWRITERHVDDDMAFVLLSGRWSGHVGRQRFGPVTGGIVIIPRGWSHGLGRLAGDCRLISLHWFAATDDGRDAIGALGFAGWFAGTGGADYGGIAQDIWRETVHQAPGWRVAFRCGIERILLMTLRYEAGSLQPPILHADSHVRAAVQAARSGYRDPDFGVEDMATAAKLSSSALRVRCRTVLAQTPGEVLREFRLRAACRELELGEASVASIAAACGFTDAAYFHRAFLRRFGCTPRTWRGTEGP